MLEGCRRVGGPVKAKYGDESQFFDLEVRIIAWTPRHDCTQRRSVKLHAKFSWLYCQVLFVSWTFAGFGHCNVLFSFGRDNVQKASCTFHRVCKFKCFLCSVVVCVRASLLHDVAFCTLKT